MATSSLAYLACLLILQPTAAAASSPSRNLTQGSGLEGGRARGARTTALLFLPGSVVQLTLGVSTALDIRGGPSGQISYGLQQNAGLPVDFTELLYPPTRTKREYFVYDHVQDMFGRYGMNASECLKKTICQIAEAPLEGGILEDVINFVFTPSNHEEVQRRRRQGDPFLSAELSGRTSGNCHTTFPDCQRSLLDLITHLEESPRAGA